MKSFYLFMGLLWVGLLSGQSTYTIARSELCWITAGADSSLMRYMLVSSRANESPTQLVYRNAAGQNVNVTGGRLYYGSCECCTRDTLPIPRIENYAEVVPVTNPMDPASLLACYRGQTGYLFGVTHPSQIVITADGVPLTYTTDPIPAFGQYTWDSVTGFFRGYSPNYGVGTGPHTMVLTVTIPSGTLTRTLNFNCG